MDRATDARLPVASRRDLALDLAAGVGRAVSNATAEAEQSLTDGSDGGCWSSRSAVVSGRARRPTHQPAAG